jgi:hypothetical protein
MYQKPTLQRFGTFRDLTQAGCQGALDGRTIEGIGTSTGSVPNATADFCFVGSR